MDKGSIYYKQVQLLVQVLPLVAQEKCFALKGGTAINLFVRNLPRLSVDIDLVFLPVKSRDDSLVDIKRALGRITDSIGSSVVGSDVHKSYEDKSDALRLIIKKAGVQIKIELSPVMRGTAYDPEDCAVTELVEDEFGFVEMPVVSLSDLYGGKICAALDRQHPRDLFDVKLLLENEGITNEIRKGCLVYMISHNRPISELLSPRLKDITAAFKSEFSSMTDIVVSAEDLVETRDILIQTLVASITDEEKQFLLSFKRRSPEWALLGIDGIKELPAVKWKLMNLGKMSMEKHAQALQKLESVIQAMN